MVYHVKLNAKANSLKYQARLATGNPAYHQAQQITTLESQPAAGRPPNGPGLQHETSIRQTVYALDSQLTCPGCQYKTPWRHRLVAHVSACKDVQVKVPLSTTMHFISQLFNIPKSQATNLIYNSRNLNGESVNYTRMLDRDSNDNNWIATPTVPSSSAPQLQPMLSPLRKALIMPPGKPNAPTGISTSRQNIPASFPHGAQPVVPNQIRVQHGVAAPQNLHANLSNDVPVDLSLNISRNRPISSKSSIGPTSPLYMQAVGQNQQLHPTIRPRLLVQMPKDPVLSCGHCPFKTTSNAQMHAHLLQYHPQYRRPQVADTSYNMPMIPPTNSKAFTCNHCAYRTSSELCMVRHLLTLHRTQLLPLDASINNGSEKLFSCSNCTFSSSENVMVKHMLDHYKKHAPCKSCSSCVDWIFPSSLNNKTVTRKVKPSNSLKKTNKSALKTTSLVKATLTKKIIDCVICKARFSTQAELKQHLATHVTPNSMKSKNLQVGVKTVEISPAASNSSIKPVEILSKTVEPPTKPVQISSKTVETITAAVDTPPKPRDTSSKTVETITAAVNTPTKLVDPPIGPVDAPTKLVDPPIGPVDAPTKLVDPSIEPNLTVVNISSCHVRSSASNASTPPPSDFDRHKVINNGCVSVPRQQSVSLVNDRTPDVRISHSVLEKTDCPMPIEDYHSKNGNIDCSISSQTIVSYSVVDKEAALAATTSENGQSSAMHFSPNRLVLNECSVPTDSGTDDGRRNHLPKKRRLPMKLLDKKRKQSKVNQPAKTKSSQRTTFPIHEALDLSIKIPLSSLPLETQMSLQQSRKESSAAVKNIITQTSEKLMPSLKSDQGFAEKDDTTRQCKEEYIYEGTDLKPDHRTGKAMANMLREKLSGIHLKTRSVTGSPTTEPTDCHAVRSTQINSPDVVLLDSDDEPSGEKECNSPNNASDGFIKALNFGDGAFIDLTLDDSDEGTDSDESETDSSSHIAGFTNTSCSVAINKLTSKPAPTDSEESSTSTFSIDVVNEIINTLVNTVVNTVDAGSSKQSQPMDIDPGEKFKHSSASSKANLNTPKVDRSESFKAGAVKHNGALNDQEPKFRRSYKQVRRRNGLCSNQSLPQTAVGTGPKRIDDEELVVCPFCPKRLLYRLLPAHIQFHGSDCEHRCKDCNFASSFKWVLDTHTLCHKESALAVDARQITPEEWRAMGRGDMLADEDVAMAQKLLIKQPLCPTRQIARKSTAKKTACSETAELSTIKKSLGATASPFSADKPVKVDKSKVLQTEDFFAKMLSKRARSKN